MNSKLLLLYLLCSLTHLFAEDFWTELPLPNDSCVLNAFSPVVNAEGNVFIATNQGLYYSTDRGLSWHTTTIQDNCFLLPLDGDQRVFLQYCNNGNYLAAFTTDNGLTWQNITYRDYFTALYAKDDLLICGFYNYLDSSVDNGANWTRLLDLGFLSHPKIDSIVSENDSTYWIGVTDFMSNPTSNGGVFCSTDGGASWQHAGLGFSYVSVLRFNSQKTLFAATSGNHLDGTCAVYKREGTRWTPLLTGPQIVAMVIDRDDNIFVGGITDNSPYYAGIWKSSNNGENWERLNSGLNNHLNIEVLSISTDGYLYTFTGDKLFRSALPTTAIQAGLPDNKSSKMNIYPNPFNNSTIIKYFLPSKAKIILSVYNSKGELVKEIFRGLQPAGEHHFEFNGSDLSTGVYLTVLTSENQQLAANKLLLIK